MNPYNEMMKQIREDAAPFIFGILIVIMALVMIFSIVSKASAEEIHFQPKEFACKHCGKILIADGLVEKLETLRFWLGSEPIIILSGYRCPLHNKNIDGATHSQHVLGRAVDIKIKGSSPEYVAKIAKKCGFTWVKAYSTFTHIDIRETKLAKN